jgi:hypothetical protein
MMSLHLSLLKRMNIQFSLSCFSHTLSVQRHKNNENFCNGSYQYVGSCETVNAKILQASTSEVYGDPLVHPQPESYWGHVNPIGKEHVMTRENVQQKPYS